MKFYNIWAKLFSFELKNTKKKKNTVKIINMSPKNDKKEKKKKKRQIFKNPISPDRKSVV